MPRKRKEPEAIPEVEALSPRKRVFVDAYTDPSKPTFGNATRSIVAAGHPDTPAAREDGSRMLARADVRQAADAKLRKVFEDAGGAEEWAGKLLRRFAEDDDMRVRSSAVRSVELVMRATGQLAAESEVQLQQLVLPQLSVSDIRAALDSGRAEAEGS